MQPVILIRLEDKMAILQAGVSWFLRVPPFPVGDEFSAIVSLSVCDGLP
jgi:hypothetical protein